MTRLRRSWFRALLILVALLLCPVRPAWAEAWKDAYLKGLEHMGAGRWAEAVQAFDVAIGANPREDMGVRLYGMRHGYFPYRDKGIALYRAERWEEAVQALQESVRQGVALDAASYLDLARRRRPMVEVPHIFRGTWWDHYERGLLYADRGLWKPAIADFRAARRVRDQEDREARTYGMHFIAYFPNRELGVALYHDGQYRAAVEALERSLARLPTSKAGYYYNLARGALLKQSAPDKSPPRVTIVAPSDGLLTNSLALEVRGTAESRNLIGTLLVNGEPEVIEVAQPSLPFATVVSLVPGPNTIEVVARDLVANESRATIGVVVDREGPVVVIDTIVRTARGGIRMDGTVYDNVRLGSLQINGQPVPITGAMESAFTWEVRAPGDTILLEAVDAAGNPTRVRLPIPAEVRQPGARQRSAVMPVAWSDDIIPAILPARDPLVIEPEPLPAEVQQETISFGFVVTATAGLASVRINGEPKTLPRTDPGKPQVLSHTLALVEGENVVTVTVMDRGGRTVTKQLRTIRKPAEVESIGSRLSVAVIPFQHKGKPSEVYQGAYDALVNTLVNQRRFRIVSRVQLEDILRELKLSKTELVDRATAIRIGRLVAAEAIMVGTINETAAEAEVYAQLINTETSTVLVDKNVFDPAKAARSAREKMQELATKIRQAYPLVGGPVVGVVNRRVAVALGEKQVREDTRVIVYLEGDPLRDPQTKLVLDRNIESLGEGLLKEVRSKTSFAALTGEDLRRVEQLIAQKKSLKAITK